MTAGGNDSITSVSFTHDGSYLAVGTHEGDTQIWDLESGGKVRSMGGHVGRVGVLAWRDHILSSGARDGRLVRERTPEDHTFREFNPSDFPAHSIYNHDVRVANHKVAELLAHTSEVCGLKWRPDGAFLASGGNDNLVNIWDARGNVPKWTKREHNAAVKVGSARSFGLSVLAGRLISFQNSRHRPLRGVLGSLICLLLVVVHTTGTFTFGTSRLEQSSLHWTPARRSLLFIGLGSTRRFSPLTASRTTK